MGILSRLRSALSLAAHTEPPELGERTGQQGQLGVRGAAWHSADHDRGFDAAPSASFKTYRRMRTNPTIAMARAAATAPIKAADWSIDIMDDAPADAEALIEETVLPRRSEVMCELLKALDFGFRAFEKVWELEDGNMVLKRLKPLSPERSEIMIDAHGNLLGVRQGTTAPMGRVTVSADGLSPQTAASPMGAVFLPLSKVFLYSYDSEDGNWYGRSRHENIRESAWWPWQQTVNRLGVYIRKTSGVIPMIRYPVGSSKDKAGNEVANDEIAARVLDNIKSGTGVTMPQNLLKWAEDMLGQGMDPTALMAWSISFLEAKAGHGREYESTLRHFESLMVRGWLLPERSVVEGQFGTKAESAAHQDFAILMAEELLDDVIRQFNEQVIDPVLLLNFGDQAAGTVRIKPAPIQDKDRDFFRRIIESMLTDNRNLDLFNTLIDLEQMLDRTDVPKLAEADFDIESLLQRRRERSPDFKPGAEEGADGKQPDPKLNGSPPRGGNV